MFTGVAMVTTVFENSHYEFLKTMVFENHDLNPGDPPPLPPKGLPTLRLVAKGLMAWAIRRSVFR